MISSEHDLATILAAILWDNYYMIIGGYDPPGDGLGMGNLSKKAEAEMALSSVMLYKGWVGFWKTRVHIFSS